MSECVVGCYTSCTIVMGWAVDEILLRELAAAATTCPVAHTIHDPCGQGKQDYCDCRCLYIKQADANIVTLLCELCQQLLKLVPHALTKTVACFI